MASCHLRGRPRTTVSSRELICRRWSSARSASPAGRPGTRLVSVEIDTERAGLVASLFADLPHVAVRPGDWREIYRAAPFDQARMHWLTHPDLAALVATRRFP